MERFQIMCTSSSRIATDTITTGEPSDDEYDAIVLCAEIQLRIDTHCPGSSGGSFNPVRFDVLDPLWNLWNPSRSNAQPPAARKRSVPLSLEESLRCFSTRLRIQKFRDDRSFQQHVQDIFSARCHIVRYDDNDWE